MNKLAIISAFMGGVKNRYMVYQGDKTLEEKFERLGCIDGISGVELCFPEDFEDQNLLKSLLEKYNLEISAINFRSRRAGIWQRGSFTSQIKSERELVVEEYKKCVDTALAFGCTKITTCSLNEGHDYIFEMNYDQAYGFFAETVGECARYNTEVRLCLEYKMNDPRGRCILGSAAETIALCSEVGMDNVGVTVDFGHSIQAHERPAQALSMVHRAGKLFHVHLNDNDKLWDWDLIPGAYNVWDSVEFIYYLQNIVKYDDFISYDVTPKEIDTVKNFQSAVNATKKLFEITERLDKEKINDLFEKRDPSVTMDYLFSIL